MKCPHCEYEDNETWFYKPHIDFTHNVSMMIDYKESREIYGCPKCNKLFMA